MLQMGGLRGKIGREKRCGVVVSEVHPSPVFIIYIYICIYIYVVDEMAVRDITSPTAPYVPNRSLTPWNKWPE